MRYFSPPFAAAALCFFMLRSMVSLFFGSEFQDYEEDNAGIFASWSAPESELSSPAPVPQQLLSTEEYQTVKESGFTAPSSEPYSTFSIDVDTASYSNVRRMLNAGVLPPKDAVRIEEMLNYFSYSYPKPAAGEPFSIFTEISEAPWAKKHRLVQVGLKARELETEVVPPSNLVFLIDVSGSMDEPNKLPLLQRSFDLLIDMLRPQDRIAIVTYAGAAGLVLPPTSGEMKNEIRFAVSHLRAGGSTAGGQGIELAYRTAEEQFIRGGNNRVILATDGDFNVGISSDAELVRLIEGRRDKGVFLSVLGFGTGNYKDSKMEQLADAGNGNYAYIDTISEAKKVLVTDLRKTLFTVAKDVKIQIEFNPLFVKAYRLLGYENRRLAKEDFNNDKKDAGEMGSGHTVTALYEIIPAGSDESPPSVNALKYQTPLQPSTTGPTDELMTINVRFKQPESSDSALISAAVKDAAAPLASTSDDFRFAAAVAEFGMLLRDSEFKAASRYDDALELARGAKGRDEQGYRAELVALIERASLLARPTQ